MSIFTTFDQMYDNSHYTTQSNVAGGDNILQDGVIVQEAHPNVHGGSDIYDSQHHSMKQTIPNVHGGVDVLVDGQLVQRTIPNVHGGEDVYDKHGHLQKHTMPNVHGGEDIYSGSQLEVVTGFDATGHETVLAHQSVDNNAAQVLQYDDPLRHVGRYETGTLIIK